MKRVTYVAAFIAALVSLTGCFLFQSGEAEIITFSMPGLVGTVTIDPSAKTVVGMVEPMNLAGVTPTVTVSEAATLSSQPALADGQAMAYVVTAENGDTQNWSVTITVQRGIAFTLDTTKVVLTEGFVDSTDATHNTAVGAGTPIAGLRTPSNQLDAYALRADQDVQTTNDYEMAWFTIAFGESTPAAGTFDETNAVFRYRVPASGASAGLEVAAGFDWGDLNLSLTALGQVGGDVVGTFFANGVDFADLSAHAIAGGFLKLLRVADDLN